MSDGDADSPIDVAVGVLIRDDGSFLMAQRPEGKPMAGYWEFPGGKLDVGESVFDALVREFDEELGLRIVTASPWVRRVVAYPHATVRLHFWRSFGEERGWRGAPQSREGQAFRWELIDRLTAEAWLEGALPVARWLRLPSTYAISNAGRVGTDLFLRRLDEQIDDGSLAQLQLREPEMSSTEFAALFDEVLARCRVHRVRLIVNSVHDRRYGERADGMHLRSTDLMRATRRPDVDWCFASCHDEPELERAGTLALDAAVLGPVLETASHPGRAGIGWSCFNTIASTTSLPVYAIGGMTADTLPQAIGNGGHGVAMIGAAWLPLAR